MKSLKLALVAVFCSLMLAPAAQAQLVQDHAIDKYGQPIWDARGDCVYTKWMVANGRCGAPVIMRAERVIYFDFNRSTIKASEQAKLDGLISKIEADERIQSVDVIGHADAIGNSNYNKRLSMKRAESVRSYLNQRGVTTRKIDVRALGESDPVTACPKSLPRTRLIACLAEDRRVEVMLNTVQ